MPLPRGDEYNQAVQNPAISFADLELQNSSVETTPLGLPKPYSGGFTTTYKFKNSIKNWAVRCFTREISDLQKRYQSIGDFTTKNNCSFLVNAKYVQKGVRINGEFHPIIKMDWLDGEPLNIYIEKIHNQSDRLNSLIIEFVNLIEQLEQYGIAHGDLQHGNIIVNKGKLYLIDYDGMYLPELANLNVNELGHPNFQHPRRTSKNYNNSIDRFSSFIIYTAIKALSINPNLWRKFENGDNLLFKGSDFINPQNSPLLKELVGFSKLEQLANNIAAVCTLEFNKIPTLNTFLNTIIPSSTIILPEVTTVRNAYLILDGRQQGQLLEHIGERVEVIGKIQVGREGMTAFGNPYVFLNFGRYPNQTFTIVIWSEGITALKNRGILINDLYSEWVSITGVISTYNGRPQMALDNPSQLRILGSESNAEAKLNYQPVFQPPQPNQSIEKNVNEEVFWDNYLRNKTAISLPELESTTSSLASPIVNRPQNTQKNTYPIPKSQKNNKHKNIKVILFGIATGIIIGLISESSGWAIIGSIVGGLVGFSKYD